MENKLHDSRPLRFFYVLTIACVSYATFALIAGDKEPISIGSILGVIIALIVGFYEKLLNDLRKEARLDSK